MNCLVSSLNNSKNNILFDLDQDEIEINDCLLQIKSNSELLEKKYSLVLVPNITFEKEKNILKEIKTLSDENILLIKKSKLLILDHINKSNKDGASNLEVSTTKTTNTPVIFKLPIKDGFYEDLKENSKNYYKGIYNFVKFLTMKMYDKYRTVKSDLSDQEIEIALLDSSPDQIFFKTSFGFSDLSKSALAYIQFRHSDLKQFQSVVKEIQNLLLLEFKINHNTITTIKKKSEIISPHLKSTNSTTLSQQQQTPIFLKKATSSKRFILFNIWCCGEN